MKWHRRVNNYELFRSSLGFACLSVVVCGPTSSPLLPLLPMVLSLAIVVCFVWYIYDVSRVCSAFSQMGGCLGAGSACGGTRRQAGHDKVQCTRHAYPYPSRLVDDVASRTKRLLELRNSFFLQRPGHPFSRRFSRHKLQLVVDPYPRHECLCPKDCGCDPRCRASILSLVRPPPRLHWDKSLQFRVLIFWIISSAPCVHPDASFSLC